MKNNIYKIKDSIDIFLSNNKYIMIYYMNTRQRKSFKINNEMVALLENIDGEKDIDDLKLIMEKEYGISSEDVESIIDILVENRIITKIEYDEGILSQEDRNRYARQINYFTEFLGSEEEGLIAQKNVINSHVMIFGCGAIGGNIALELVMAGVRNITLFDYDIVENSDVSRHMYFTKKDIGRKKTHVLKEQLEKIDSHVNIEIIDRSLRPEDDLTDIIDNVDFVVNTLDEPYIGYTSSKISRICMKKRIAHFIAGGFDAHLASTGEIIVPYVTPCVECYATHFKEKLKNWKPKQHPVKTRYTEIGGLASMSLFSTSYAVIEIIKYIAKLVNINDTYKVRGELLFNDLSLTYLSVNKNPDCPICGGVE